MDKEQFSTLFFVLSVFTSAQQNSKDGQCDIASATLKFNQTSPDYVAAVPQDIVLRLSDFNQKPLDLKSVKETCNVLSELLLPQFTVIQPQASKWGKAATLFDKLGMGKLASWCERQSLKKVTRHLKRNTTLNSMAGKSFVAKIVADHRRKLEPDTKTNSKRTGRDTR
jgi:hypothetical protein